MKKIIIIILLCPLLLLSCNKYLDIQSNNRLVVPNSLEDLQGLLDNSKNMNLNYCGLGERSSDNVYVPLENLNTLAIESKEQYLWKETVYNYANDWSAMYTTVYNANLVLEKIEDIQRDSGNVLDWDRIKGSALLFRSAAYLSLLWTHSKAFDTNTAKTDLGIVLRETSDFNVKSVRSSVEQGYNQVLADLHAAEPLLPTEATHAMRPSKLAVYGLLARTYLSMCNYKQALVYANAYLNIKHELMNYNDQGDVKASANYPFAIFNRETAFFTQLRSSTVTAAYSSIDTLLYLAYDTNDLRKQLFFKITKGIINFKGQYTGALALFGGIATDEIYLTRAECLAREGKLDAALADLNLLLEKRYKTGTFIPINVMNATDLLDTILLERRKELVYRGLRWMDIKRLNLEGREIHLIRQGEDGQVELKPNDNRYAIALPDDIIRITGMLQNPR